jgi:hypothetical protein
VELPSQPGTRMTADGSAGDPAGDPYAPVTYNKHGYDMAPRPRCVYAFVSSDSRRVKVGLVNTSTRLDVRLTEVAKACDERGLRLAAHVVVDDVDGHEIEDVEAAVRLWLVRARGFAHLGRVDWLRVPEGMLDWQALLDDAIAAIESWSSPPAPRRTAL